MVDYYGFFDETGTRELDDERVKIFGYAGFVIPKNNYNSFNNNFYKIKEKYKFKELKSNWLRIPKERKKHYEHLSDEEIKKMMKEIYTLINNSNIYIFGSMYDKEKMKIKYKHPFNPSSLCYEYLLQRLANFSTQYSINQLGVCIDDFSGKSKGKNDWKDLLIKEHSKLIKGIKSNKNFPSMDYSKINKNIKFEDSKKIYGIQVADLIAYNIGRQCRDHWDHIDNFSKDDCYPYYEIIYKKIHKNPHEKMMKSKSFGVVQIG